MIHIVAVRLDPQCDDLLARREQGWIGGIQAEMDGARRPGRNILVASGVGRGNEPLLGLGERWVELVPERYHKLDVGRRRREREGAIHRAARLYRASAVVGVRIRGALRLGIADGLRRRAPTAARAQRHDRRRDSDGDRRGKCYADVADPSLVRALLLSPLHLDPSRPHAHVTARPPHCGARNSPT